MINLIYQIKHEIIRSPEWVINKKITINPKNNDGKCFQYALTPPLFIKALKAIQKE